MPDLPLIHHVPVLLGPVLEAARGAVSVSPHAVDATLGHGGHAGALAEAGLRVLGIDRDPDAIATARARLGDRIDYLQAAYDSPEALAAVARLRPGFVLLDLGVSSRQLDDAGRGFTFRPGASLDMRMGAVGSTAAELLNREPAAALERIFAEYGDERRARRLAREIERRRAHHPFATSDDLVNAIRAVLGPRAGPPDFARLFQAVRIAVNDELEGLAAALPAFRDALVPGGALVVADHSAQPGAGIGVVKSLHRIEESVLRRELEAAGFRLAAEADFLRNPDDLRDAVVFRAKIPVDEFVLKFVKPKDASAR